MVGLHKGFCSLQGLLNQRCIGCRPLLAGVGSDGCTALLQKLLRPCARRLVPWEAVRLDAEERAGRSASWQHLAAHHGARVRASVMLAERRDCALQALDVLER